MEIIYYEKQKDFQYDLRNDHDYSQVEFDIHGKPALISCHGLCDSKFKGHSSLSSTFLKGWTVLTYHPWAADKLEIISNLGGKCSACQTQLEKHWL